MIIVVLDLVRMTATRVRFVDAGTPVMLHGSFDLAELPIASPRAGRIRVYGVLWAAERADAGVCCTDSQPHGTAP